MEFPFPPPPPEYVRVLAARWLCLGWTLAALGWLVTKVRWRKTVMPIDILWWGGIAFVGSCLVDAGMCRPPIYDDNAWVLPLATAVVSVSIAGASLAFIKLYLERRWGEIIGSLLGIAVCLALVLPPVGPTREHGRRTQCKNMLMQIGLAMHNYHETWSHFPASAAGDPAISWRVALLPFLGGPVPLEKYDPRAAWDAESNLKLATRMMEHYRCPSNHVQQDAQGRWFTAYSMPTGPHTVGANPKGTQIREIADGTSNTLLVVEACGSQIVWTEPRDVDVSVQPTGINLKGNAPGHSAGWLSSYHAGGTQVLLADGSVRFLSAQTDPAVLKKLATVDGGEVVGDY